jgi:hypothetical protein
VRGAKMKSVQQDNAQNSSYSGNLIEGADILLQPVEGGVCQGNGFQNNKLTNAQIVSAGCK